MTQNISMEEYSRITPQIEDLTERWSKNCHIDRALYQKYDVKRGLRDANGRGVLASLTRISEVKGYTVDGNDTIPCEGVLYYRGYDVRELVNGSLSDKRFGLRRRFTCALRRTADRGAARGVPRSAERLLRPAGQLRARRHHEGPDRRHDEHARPRHSDALLLR